MDRRNRVWFARAAISIVLLMGIAGSASAQPNPAPGKPKIDRRKNPGPDPLEELEKLKVEFEGKLLEQEQTRKNREEDLRKEHTAALGELRAEAERRQAGEKAVREEEIKKLRQALDDAAAKQELKEKSAPPKLNVAFPGVSLGGYVQADLQFRQSSEDQLTATSGKPLNEDRFVIRRARIAVDLDRGFGEGRIEIDGNTIQGSTFRLIVAEASVKLPPGAGNTLPLLKGTIGLFKIPFGAETQQADRKRLFIERSLVSRALFPGEYDLGAKVSGAWQFVRYELAWQNGQPLGSTSFAGIDPNHHKDLVGRLGVQDTIHEKIEVSAGVSAIRGTGFHAGALGTKPTVQIFDTNEDGSISVNEIKGVPGTAAGTSSSFTRYGFGADVLLSGRLLPLGESQLAAEFFLANDLDRGVYPADPNGSLGRSLRELGYVFSIRQRIRQFEIGIRYDYYNPDRDANQLDRGVSVPTNVSYSSLAVACAVIAPWGRFIVEYDKNWNHVGINNVGMPSNLKNDAFFLRGEAGF